MSQVRLDADGGCAVVAWWRGWRERHFAYGRCRELLRLHRQVSERHPGLTGLSLYRRIVAAHLHADTDSVETVLRLAEDSYAIWPVSRSLNFRDVVHYLSVTEYFAWRGGRQQMLADVKRVVDDTIPGHL